MNASADPLQSTIPLFVDAGASLPAALRRKSSRLTSGGPIAVEDAPAHSPRLLLVGPVGSGKSVGLHRIAAAAPESCLVHLDGTRGLSSLAEPALPAGLLLVDGLERLDDAQRGAALTELLRLKESNPELRYVVAQRAAHVLDEVPGEVVGLRPLTPSQITNTMREAAGDALARKAFRSSEDLILNLGRRPLYVGFLLEVLIGYGNLPPTREKLLRALVDHRIDQEVASGLTAEDLPWQIREPLASVAWELIASADGTHRVSEEDVRAAFARALANQGGAGDGAQELEVARRAGLLQDAPGDTLMFPNSELESWFAACDVSHRIQYSGSADFLSAGSPRCHDAIVLAAAQLENASLLVRRCLHQGQDLLVALCLRAGDRGLHSPANRQRQAEEESGGQATPAAETAHLEQTFLTRLGSRISERMAPEDRESSLTALVVLDTPAARQRLLDTMRAAIAPQHRQIVPGRRRGGASPPPSPRIDEDDETLRLLPERLEPFLPALGRQPPSSQRRIIGQLARTRREHEFVAAAHLFRLLDLDLDSDTMGALLQFTREAPGNRHMQSLLESLGHKVIGRYLFELLEYPDIVRNPFPLGRLLRGGCTAEATEALLEAMENPDEQVRQVPVFVLAGVGDPVAMGEVEASATSGHESRRWFAAAALEGVTGGNAIETLGRLAEDGSPRVRKQARSSLAASNRQRDWQELEPAIAALGDAPSPERCLEIAERALSLGDARALDRIVEGLSEGARSALVSGIRAELALPASGEAGPPEVPDPPPPTEEDARAEDRAKGRKRGRGRRRSGGHRRTLSPGRRVLEALREKWQRKVVAEPEIARTLLGADEISSSLVICCLERLVEEDLTGVGQALPIQADHPSIQRALETLWSHRRPRPGGTDDRDASLPAAGSVLTGRLGAKQGTLCEVLRRGILRGEVAGAERDDKDAGAWALHSLEEIGGNRELLRLVSDPLFGQTDLPNVRTELEKRRVVPTQSPRPDPLVSVAARRATEWFGKDRGRGKATGGFPESDVEVRLDPWPYLWFRRFAPPQRKSELGAALATLLARDELIERRDRNMNLIRKLDGGLLPRAYKAAGIEPPAPKSRRKEPQRSPRKGRDERPTGEADAPVSRTEEAASAAPGSLANGAPPPPVTEPASPAVSRSADRCPEEPTARARGAGEAAERSPLEDASPPVDGKPESLLELVRGWWIGRTEVATTGRGVRRRGRKGENQRMRELIEAISTGERSISELESGVLAALVALAPSAEDMRSLLATREIRVAADADLRANPDAPWHREATRRLQIDTE